MVLDDLDNIEIVEGYDLEYYKKAHCDEDDFIIPGLVLSDIGECNIIVNHFGGMTPHFEIHALNGSFKTCIEIFDGTYYFRNNEFQKLSDRQVDELIAFLNSESKTFDTKYGEIWFFWRNLNNLKKYKYYNMSPSPKPDYNLLKGGL